MVLTYYNGIRRNKCTYKELSRSALEIKLVNTTHLYAQISLVQKKFYSKVVFTKSLIVPKTVSLYLPWTWVSPYCPK